MLFKRIISIIIILNIYLCYCNVVFAKEVSQNTNEEFYRYTLIYELGGKPKQLREILVL